MQQLQKSLKHLKTASAEDAILLAGYRRGMRALYRRPEGHAAILAEGIVILGLLGASGPMRSATGSRAIDHFDSGVSLGSS
jgi:hypothetical protein